MKALVSKTQQQSSSHVVRHGQVTRQSARVRSISQISSMSSLSARTLLSSFSRSHHNYNSNIHSINPSQQSHNRIRMTSPSKLNAQKPTHLFRLATFHSCLSTISQQKHSFFSQSANNNNNNNNQGYNQKASTLSARVPATGGGKPRSSGLGLSAISPLKQPLLSQTRVLAHTICSYRLLGQFFHFSTEPEKSKSDSKNEPENKEPENKEPENKEPENKEPEKKESENKEAANTETANKETANTETDKKETSKKGPGKKGTGKKGASKKEDQDPADKDQDDGFEGYGFSASSPLFRGFGMFSWAITLLSLHLFWRAQPAVGTEIDWKTFKNKLLPEGQVDNLLVSMNSKRVIVHTKPEPVAEGEHAPANVDPHIFHFSVPDIGVFERKLEEIQTGLGIHPADQIPIMYTQDMTKWVVGALQWAVPICFVTLLFVAVFRRLNKNTGMLLEATQKKVTMEKNIKTKFRDVAGLNEAKTEIMEFVDFLKNPGRYEKLGAKIPKGAILVGPPGTGKTLIARATAGEAGVPFFNISGSNFVEMFVGVGPSRVRDLFEEARENAPCIVFIDEIDAIGRKRSSSNFRSNDERENTLNQLLVEMDGFETKSGVVVLAGTNRPDVLDAALLRPGRFDRQIQVDPPDIKGRLEILNLYLKKVKLHDDQEEVAKRLATLTPGFSGADLANIVNEGALIAARNNQPDVTLVNLESAIERVIGGIERKTRVLSPPEKTIVAFHEAGHAVTGWFLEHVDPLLKVSIVPRGVSTLGYAQYHPKDQYLYTKEQLEDRMCMTLGGRIAETLVFDRVSTGAQDDLEKVTKQAYDQVTKYGMDSLVGWVSFPSGDSEDGIQLEHPYSESTARLIDSRVKEMVSNAYRRTTDLLTLHKEELKLVAHHLLEHEVLKREDMISLIGPRPFQERTTFEEQTYEDLKSSATHEEQATPPAETTETAKTEEHTKQTEKKEE